jgi:broad specificity phosphatase PhoE
MGQIFLVRHGQASFGETNYDQLSVLGAQQGRMLGSWFAQRGQQFHRIVCGDMHRHRQTASACLAELNLGEMERESDPGFNEYNHHQVMARYRPEFDDPLVVKRFLRETPNGARAFQREFELSMARWMDGKFDHEYDESWPQFRARVVASFRGLLETAQSAHNVVVFTSGGTISTLCQHVLDMPDRKMVELNFSLANAGVTKLFVQPGRVALSYLNNFSHLDLPGDENAVTYL